MNHSYYPYPPRNYATTQQLSSSYEHSHNMQATIDTNIGSGPAVNDHSNGVHASVNNMLFSNHPSNDTVPQQPQPPHLDPVSLPAGGSRNSSAPRERIGARYAIRPQIVSSHVPSRLLEIPESSVWNQTMLTAIPPYNIPQTQCPYTYPDGVRCLKMSKKSKGTRWSKSTWHWDEHIREELQWMSMKPQYIGMGSIITSEKMYKKQRFKLDIPVYTMEEFIASYFRD